MAIITISRGSMSGGETLAQCLAAELGYPCIGRDILVEAAAKLGVSEETLTKKFEKSPGLWARLTSDRRLYVIAVQAALAEHARTGDLVYHGHAGHLLLKGIPNVLRVRLIAPLEMRVRAVMERQHLGHDAAVEYIRAVDEDRIRWTKFLYGVDWRDPSLYDLIINLENMSIRTACAVVGHAVVQAEYAMSDAVRRKLQDFHLACQVKVALARNPQTRGVEFEVQADDGVVDVFGEMPAAGMLARTSHRGEKEIHQTVSAVEGVKTVRVHIKEFDAYH